MELKLKEKAVEETKDAPDESEEEYDSEEDLVPKPGRVMSKSEATKIWEIILNKVPSDYTFQVKTGSINTYPKGSQVHICYGRISNRQLLKRYGFCLTNNKYNHLFIKLRLDIEDPDFKYRFHILEKFFSMEIDKKKGGLQVGSRHFKIYYQRFNTKVLKFVKILTYDVKKDEINCIIETRSLSLEYLSL